jgi:two-component system, cell cycle sensor histidine kinase and response regulator CckA
LNSSRDDELERLERENRELQAALWSAEGRIQALQRLSPFATLVVAHFPAVRTISRNDAFDRIVGLAASDPFDVEKWILTAVVDPTAADMLARTLLDPSWMISERELTFRLRDPSGDEREVVGRVAALPDSQRAMAFRDVTVERAATRELHASEERYRKLVEHAPDGIIAHDGGKIVFVNPAAIRIIGATHASQLIGQPVMQFVHPDYRAMVAQRMRAVIQLGNDLVPAHERFVTLGGQTIDVDVVASVVEMGGHKVSQVVFRDITERLAEQEAGRRLAERMNAGQRLESLALLAGGVAHDFNNLLMGILGHVQLARETPTEMPLDQRLAVIEGVALQARDLARQLLSYAGGNQLELELVDLSALVERSADLVRASVPRKIELEWKLGSGLHLVKGDPTQMVQVLLNLVNNAAEAIGDLSGTIEVRTAEMDAAGDEAAPLADGDRLHDRSYVMLEVKDSGPGISAEVQAKVFDPFFSTRFTGRGLGLAAVAGIARGHGGAVALRTEPGEGATFTVYFPASEERARAVVDAAPAPPTARFRGAGRVLVVDDEEIVRDVVARMVEAVGFQVVAVGDGNQAIAAVGAAAEPFDLVLLDQNMPQLSGVETFRVLRSLAPDLPVIMCSGLRNNEPDERLGEDGPVGFLPKPFSLQQLSVMLDRALKQQTT